MSPAFRLSLLLFFFLGRKKFCMKNQYSLQVIQDKEHDNQDEIDQDQPQQEQTSLMKKSSPSQDNKDIVIDATFVSVNFAEVRN